MLIISEALAKVNIINNYEGVPVPFNKQQGKNRRALFFVNPIVRRYKPRYVLFMRVSESVCPIPSRRGVTFKSTFQHYICSKNRPKKSNKCLTIMSFGRRMTRDFDWSTTSNCFILAKRCFIRHDMPTQGRTHRNDGNFRSKTKEIGVCSIFFRRADKYTVVEKMHLECIKTLGNIIVGRILTIGCLFSHKWLQVNR